MLDYSPSSSQPDAPKSRRSLVDNMSGTESGTVAPATTETRLETVEQRLDSVLRILERFTQHTTPASPPASGAGPSRVEAAAGQPELAECVGGEEVPQVPPPVDVSGARQVTYINPYDYAHLIPAGWEFCRPPPTAALEPRVYDISADVTIQRLEGGPAAAIDEYYVLVCNGFYNECAIQASRIAVAALREKHPDSAAILGELEAALNTQAVVADSYRSRMFSIRNARQPGRSEVEKYLEAVTRQQLFRPSSAFQGDCAASRFHDAFHDSIARHAIPFAGKQALKELMQAGKAKGGKGRQTEAESGPKPDGSKGTDKRPAAGKK